MKTIDLRRGWLVLGLAMLALPSTAQDLLQASSDTTIRVGTNGVDLPDEGIGMLDQAGTVLRQPLPGIPQGAELTAYAVEPGDAVILLSFANDVALPGPVFARGGDVVRFEDFGYAIGLDAGAAGLPRSARIDGVSSTGSGGLLISFDTTVELGAGLVAADEDLVDWERVELLARPGRLGDRDRPEPRRRCRPRPGKLEGGDVLRCGGQRRGDQLR